MNDIQSHQHLIAAMFNNSDFQTSVSKIAPVIFVSKKGRFKLFDHEILRVLEDNEISENVEIEPVTKGIWMISIID